MQIFYDWFVNFLFHRHELCSFCHNQPFLGPQISSNELTYFSKVRSSRFVETFIIALRSAVAKKRSVISFLAPFSLSSFSFLVLVLAAKHRSHVSTKSGSSRDNWYLIGDAIVVMCKVSTNLWLIKSASYSQ